MKRFWLDANVILRFLTKQPPEQAERALTLFERAETEEIALAVPVLTVAEVTWVLHCHFGAGRRRWRC